MLNQIARIVRKMTQSRVSVLRQKRATVIFNNAGNKLTSLLKIDHQKK